MLAVFMALSGLVLHILVHQVIKEFSEGQGHTGSALAQLYYYDVFETYTFQLKVIMIMIILIFSYSHISNPFQIPHHITYVV
jgi:hypothetical protein